MYGAGQWRYSYQGHDIIKHGGSNPGYRTQVARFPDDNLGIIILSNDENGVFAWSSKIPHRKRNSWTKSIGLKRPVIYFHAGALLTKMHSVRYVKKYNEEVKKAQQLTPRPSLPRAPSGSFAQLAKSSFSHPTYGILQPRSVPGTVKWKIHNLPSPRGLLASHSVQRILQNSDLFIPILIIPWKRSFSTHLRLAHFSVNLFNVTVIWSNAEVREKEGFESGGDVLYGLDNHYEVEWVHGEEEGLAFKDGF